MVKYRRLSLEELNQLEQEFIRFLAAQSITADDWIKIKAKDKEREETLVEAFSDVVIEKTLFNAKYLEQRTPQRILCYKIEPDGISLNGLEVESSIAIDFTSGFQLTTLVSLFEDEAVKISFLSGTKQTDEIQKEVFDLIEEGALISDTADLYNFINTLKENYSEEE